MSEGLFEGAEIISVYTRAQAIEDGVLVDVSEMAREAGFKFHAVFTQALFTACTPPKSNVIESFAGRAWDVLWLGALAARRNPGQSRVTYTVRIGRKNHQIVLDCGPGDEGEPVMTLGYQSDF